MDADDLSAIEAIYQFWFGAQTPSLPDKARNKLWFSGGPEVDAEIKAQFGDLSGDALQGELDYWADSPRGRLALILALDQFTRNIFRGTKAAFSGDGAALALCREGLALGHHESLGAIELTFFYLPLEHSENLADQERCVHLFNRLLEQVDGATAAYVANSLRYAEDHRAIVKRFGRFPHRNRALQRTDTPLESAYLAKSGRQFGQ